jgi:hypothetical protein
MRYRPWIQDEVSVVRRWVGLLQGYLMRYRPWLQDKVLLVRRWVGLLQGYLIAL